MEYHGVECEDNFVMVDEANYEGNFYKLGKLLEIEQHPDYDPKMIFQMLLYLQPQGVNHRREAYNSLDLIGDLGGAMEVFIVVFGLFITPISKFAFILKATKMLFHARTTDS